jgi:Golgi SNAP receptor complex protein 2
MHRTVDDYDSMAKREIIKAKQEKAQMRVQKFRADYTELRTQFDRLKNTAAAEEAAARRNDLLSTSSAPLSPSDARRRFQASSSALPPHQEQQLQHSESPFRTPTPMYHAALDEHTFIQNTEARIDEFLAQGREVLDNLVDQRHMLKGTQRRLIDAANTLGLSRNVIGWIERRSTQDLYIFFGGAVFTFFCFFLIWKYLG